MFSLSLLNGSVAPVPPVVVNARHGYAGVLISVLLRQRYGLKTAKRFLGPYPNWKLNLNRGNCRIFFSRRKFSSVQPRARGSAVVPARSGEFRCENEDVEITARRAAQGISRTGGCNKKVKDIFSLSTSRKGCSARVIMKFARVALQLNLFSNARENHFFFALRVIRARTITM